MASDSFGEKRKKKKDKKREKKKHPYKAGGKFRTGGVKVVNKKS